VLANIYALWLSGSAYEPALRIITNLSPLAPTLVFAYYIFRRRLLPMVFERTLVYGALLLTIVYLHRLTLVPLMERYSQQYHFDLVVVEALVLVGLILAYQPLRRRIREALRYLVGGEVERVRSATHDLAIELSQQSNVDMQQICEWFTDGIMRRSCSQQERRPVVCHSEKP